MLVIVSDMLHLVPLCNHCVLEHQMNSTSACLMKSTYLPSHVCGRLPGKRLRKRLQWYHRFVFSTL